MIEARVDPEMAKWFARHRERWKAGEIRLIDFCERFVNRGDGEAVPLWYPEDARFSRKMIELGIDKAVFFEKINYQPSEPGCRAHASLAHVKNYAGGSRAGKSLWGAMEAAPILCTPETQGWILGPEYFNTVKEFRYLKGVTVEHEIVAAVLKASGARVARCVDRPKQGDMEIRIQWPHAEDSWVRCKSAKTLPTLMSEELDWILVCEAALIKGEIWHNKLRMRMADRNGMALFPYSPAGTGWTKELFDRGMEGEEGYFSISVDSRTNPTLDSESVAFWAKGMPEADFEEQVRGRPTPKHGLVYPGFDMEIHVRSYRSDWPQPVGAIKKPGWRRAKACDFGYQDPHVTLWAALDEDRRVYVYRELYRKHMLVDDVAEFIARAEGREFTRDSRGRIRVSNVVGSKDPVKGPTITDWDAQMRAELSQRGIKCRRANKELMAGIETVAAHLRVQGDARTRLYVHPSCKNLIRELRNYQWAAGGGDRPAEMDDHAVDALRYLLHTLRPTRGQRVFGFVR